MFGFIFGAACLVGLIKTVRGGGRGWHGAGYGHHGEGRWGGGWSRGGWSRGGGFPGRWVLRGISQRLDLTPGQEKVFQQAIDEVMEQGNKLREQMKSARPEVAKAMKGEHFDQASLRELFERQQAAMEEMRKAAMAELQKLHEVLDPQQRERLASILESGFGHSGHGHHGGHGCGRRGWGGGRWEQGSYSDAQSV